MHLRRFWFVLIACFALGPPLLRAQAVVTGTITGSQCVQIDVTGKGMASISVTNSASGSAWSGTIQPQVAIGGDPAQNTSVYPTGSSTAQSTITANNVYQSVSVSGATLFQVCGNTVTNTANIKLTAVALSGRNGGGGGGGGTNNPGGSSGQVQANGGSVFTGFTVGGDGTLNTTTGALSITALHFGSTDLTLSGSAPTSGQCLYAASSSSIGGEGCLTGATANGGLLQTSTTLGLLTSCSTNQVLEWNGSAWACTTPSTGIPSGTVGQIITYNSSNAAVATSNIIDNSQSGGSGVTLVGLVTFSGSAFQWYGILASSSVLSCGSNAEGFGADASAAPNPSWCNSTGTGAIYWSGNFSTGVLGGVIYGTGAGTANAQTWAHLSGPTITAYTNGMLVAWIPAASNTSTTPTLSLDSTTPATIVRVNATTSGGSGPAFGPLAANDIYIGGWAMAMYNASVSEWILLNPTSGGGGGSGTVTAVTGVSPVTSTGGTTPAIGCATCVTSAGSLTSTAIMTGAGSQGSQTPSATATLSSGGNVSFPGTLSADGIAYPTSLTSGGVLYGSSSSALTSSGVLANGQFVLGGGAGGAPTTSFSVVPNTNGGTGSNSSSATGVAQVASGTWSFSPALANGTTATTQLSSATPTTLVATIGYVAANAVTNPCSAAAIGSLIYQSSSALGCLAAPTGPTGVPNIVSTIPGSAPTYGPAGVSVNAQSGSSYTVALTDRGGVVQTTNNTTSTALTVPSPTSTGYGQSDVFLSLNTGTVVLTATPSSSTVNGNSTLKEVGAVSGHNPQGCFWYTDNSNWWSTCTLPTDANGKLASEGVASGSITNAMLANPATTVQGQTCTLGSSCNINSVTTAHGVALNEGSATQLGGTAVGTTGTVLLGNSGADPSFGAVSLTADVTGVLPFANMSQLFVTNAQTATYQVLAADFVGCKTIPISANTFTVTLVASGSQPASGQCIWVINYGTGTPTIARSGQNINGAGSNLTLAAGSAAAPTGAFIVSDGTNYEAQVFGSSGGGGGANTSLSNLAGTTAINSALLPGTTNSIALGSSSFVWSNLFATQITIGGGTVLTTSNQTGTGSLVLAASPTLTGAPAAPTQTAGDTSTDIATDAFVSTAISNAIAAVNPAVAVLAASTANLTGSYTQVGGGIGDTFTITATGAFSLDGIAINTIGQRVLLKNQTTASQNGVYTATVVGTTGVSAVFTRALDYDTPSDVNNTGSIPVQSGTVNTTTSWLLTSQVTSIGSAGSSITYAQFSVSPSTLVTSAAALTSGQAMIGQGGQASATGDLWLEQFIPAANCNNATAGAGWSIPSGGTVTCRAGSVNLGGYIAITDTSTTFAQFALAIPGDWDTANGPYIRFQLAYPGTDGASSHTIIPQINVACISATSGISDNPALNGVHSSSTITLSSATANLFFSTSNVQMNSTDTTNCVANGWMIIQVGRATDTATSAANFYGATVTWPHKTPGTPNAN
jgi:hypothetical protein